MRDIIIFFLVWFLIIFFSIKNNPYDGGSGNSLDNGPESYDYYYGH